ncbi:Cysteinyl-tRNA synthetase [Spraguea lophii 42_110]|uniref:cysteine--tRNA ligase n=1 Tax=Spraguea lophii (strain 42_110) TaxID=1358809 RepID=S7XSM9_SPRLO|nr:Cysteinyl-tRNA synthetase [Spraguea lophii 42_110]
MKIFNTITKREEDLIIKDNTIKWYNCGPTVYDSPHLGHARTYIMFDVIRRIFEDYYGYDVIYVMNITNIDDKIINKAKELKMGDMNKAVEIVYTKYEKEFFDGLEKLNVKLPTFVTHVTDYVGKIIEFIEELENKGIAYESNGSVYFDMVKYKEKRHAPIFVPDSAVEEEGESNEKKNKIDFVLWKKAKEGEIFYESKWGEGRPGWHIECSAMAADIFGDELDIHTGAVDLKFPHHENEIHQCQAYFDKEPWVRYFMHSGHLHIDGLKMSKSLKNFITIEESLKKYTSRQLRILFLNTPYNAPMTYKIESMEYAKVQEARIFNFLSVAESKIKDNKNIFKIMTMEDRMVVNMLIKAQKEVRDSFEDNFNTFKTMTAILNLISVMNQKIDTLTNSTILAVKNFIEKILRILGVITEEVNKTEDNDVLDILGEYRNAIRKLAAKKKDHSEFFAESDKLREKLKEKGYIIEDNGKDSRIRKIV